MSDDIGRTAFGVQAGIGFFGKLTTAVVGFFGSIFLARALGPSDYGLFYVALGVANLLSNPVSGWAVACKKRLTEPEFDVREAVGSVLIVIVALTVTGVPLAYGILSVVTTNDLLPLAVPILFVPLATYQAFTTVLSGRANFSLSEWALVANTILKVVSQVGLVVLGLGIWGMIGGVVVGTLLVVPVVYRWIGVRPSTPSMEALRSIARFSRWSIPRGFVGTGLSKMDVVLLGWLAAASAAGDYQIALQVSMPAVFVSGAISAGLMARISNLETRGQDWHDDFRNALSVGSVLAIPIFVGSLVMAESIVVTVFSDQYAGAGRFLVGLALYRLLVTQTVPRESVVSGLNRPDLNFWVSLAELCLNVTLGLGLWYVYGPIGIVAATVVTQAFSYTTQTVVVRRLTDVETVVTRPFLEQVGAGGVMGVVVWLVKRFLGLGEWYIVVAVVGLGGVVYFVTLFGISSYHRETVRGIYADFAAEHL